MVTTQETPLRTCPECGEQERTTWERCRHCGTSYFATPKATVRRRRLRAAGAGVIVAIALVAAGVLALRDADDRRARERADSKQAVAALRARLARIQAPHRGAAPELRPPAGSSSARQLQARAALVSAVEASITRDARGRAQAGELDGPIAETVCGPLTKSKEAIPDDRVLAKQVGRYDCVAVKRPIVDESGAQVASLGHPFVAALDFKTYKYTWCRNTPAQGERGEALVFVRLERACLAAKGRALGTGYVDVPGT
ncbi:MAG: hypothetical protein HZB46_16345 [Solirubrobacterales bacterium]|nr:hypothetical protein [Solirubrobacterales bacterium]